MPEFTHSAVGWTRLGAWPVGFRPLHRRILVGNGESDFRRLAEGILTFELHRRAGLTVVADKRATVGGTVTVGFGTHSLRLKIPCAVVWVENDGDAADGDYEDHPASQPGIRRAGFGYGTLPGHPECGEESFAAVLDADGSVYFELHAYSRHANWFYRLGAPVARFCQELVTRRYLTAARHLAAAAG